jgi:hypothetical protein
MNAVDFGLADRISSGSVGDRKSVELVRQSTLPFATLPVKPPGAVVLKNGPWARAHGPGLGRLFLKAQPESLCGLRLGQIWIDEAAVVPDMGHRAPFFTSHSFHPFF